MSFIGLLSDSVEAKTVAMDIRSKNVDFFASGIEIRPIKRTQPFKAKLPEGIKDMQGITERCPDN